MIVVTNIRKLPDTGGRNLITLGKFDGVHIGHRRLFEVMREKKKNNSSIVAFTFDMSMRGRLTGKIEKSIFDREEKTALLQEQGVDILIECPFTDEIRLMEPEAFVRDILIDRLNAGTVVIGEDFCFGHDRKGNAELLKKLSQVYDYEFIKLEKVCSEGEEVSSTLIRSKLVKGDIEAVNRYLGFEYYILETVETGARLGRTIGFPTINQKVVSEKLLPPYGVYASRVTIDGKIYMAISNLGVKPTVTDSNIPVLETNIFDFDGDIYGRTVKTQLLSFIRPEKKFSDIKELREQIKSDKEKVLNYNKTIRMGD